MKKNILKAIIFITGVTLSYIAHFAVSLYYIKNVELYFIALTIIFITSIYFFNSNIKNTYSFPFDKSIIKKKLVSKNEITKHIKVINQKKIIDFTLLKVLFVSIILGTYFGFLFKKPGERMLGHARSLDSEWQKDLFLEQMRNYTNFFSLKTYYNTYEFLFNWNVFSVTIISILSIYYILKKTIIFDIYIKPIIKRETNEQNISK